MPCIQRDEGSSQCLCHDPFGDLMKPMETLSEKVSSALKKKKKYIGSQRKPIL